MTNMANSTNICLAGLGLERVVLGNISRRGLLFCRGWRSSACHNVCRRVICLVWHNIAGGYSTPTDLRHSQRGGGGIIMTHWGCQDLSEWYHCKFWYTKQPLQRWDIYTAVFHQGINGLNSEQSVKVFVNSKIIVTLWSCKYTTGMLHVSPE